MKVNGKFIIVYRRVIQRQQPRNVTRPGGAVTIIRGKVVDTSDKPLPGVSVVFKDHVYGVMTDANGMYAINVGKGNKETMLFSFIGMKTEVVSVNCNVDEKTINVTLKETSSQLNEVVVTGYQQIDRRNLTSSVTSMSMKDLMIPGVSSLDQMLQGRIPDMIVTNSSGEINSVPKIRIRGTSTLIGNREPLWVVDGVIVNDPVNLSADVLNDPDYINRIGNAISGLNPQDIDRLDVLKDAAATALYGTRAANGVIVITTKKGRVGKPIVSYNFNGSFRRRPYYTDRKINLMNSKERTEISRELVEQHYAFPSNMTSIGYEDAIQKYYSGLYTESEFERQVAKYETQNTDWFKFLCHNSFSTDHSVNISGGTDKLRYYTSLGYTNGDDVINNNDDERYTINSNMDFTLNRDFQISLNINAYSNKRKYNQSNLNPIDYAYNTSRVIPAYNDDGTYYYYNKVSDSYSYKFNFLNELDNSYVKQNITSITATSNLRYHPVEWFNLEGVFSYTNSNTNVEGWWGEKSWYASTLRYSEYGDTPPNYSDMPYGGELSQKTIHNESYMARFQANINRYFGCNKQNNINIAIGSEVNSVRYRGFSIDNRGYYLDRGEKFVTYIPTNYTAYYAWLVQNSQPTITDNLTNLLSIYGTLTYSYENYFTINANARYDGSNKFGSRSNKKILPVWSVSGLADFKSIFNIKTKWLNNLSLKSSYGEQGNMIDGQTAEMTLQKGVLDTYYNELYSTVSGFANPYLKWEKTRLLNFGLEASLFNNRLMFLCEYYYKRTTNAFMNKNISDINGYTSYIVNSGAISNSGYNLSFTIVPMSNRNVNWILSGSFSKVINKMDAAPGVDTYSLSDYLNGNAIVKGKPVSTFYSYKFVGLDPTDGGPLFDDWEDRCTDLMGLSKNATYNKVLVASGRRDPDISGSISNTFSYKSWRLGVLMNYSLGAKVRLFRIYSQASSGSSNPGSIYPEYNLNRTLLKRWKKPGDELHTNIPSIMSKCDVNYDKYSANYSSVSSGEYAGVIIANNSWEMYDYSDLRVVSANYLRIANVSLTYELPRKLLDKCKFHRIALTLSGANLYSFCAKALKGQAPTQSGFAEVRLSDTPIYTFGINLEF
ncbi:MAG: SusC/RagA family TonB-linked outer membrane protein [Bacteroidales bacterium]|nr:SusC/RagA family TonB-linked outer membrane protein [Bacteroidales bacterium]